VCRSPPLNTARDSLPNPAPAFTGTAIACQICDSKFADNKQARRVCNPGDPHCQLKFVSACGKGAVSELKGKWNVNLDYRVRERPFDVALGTQNTLDIDSLAPIVEASGFTVEEEVASDLPMVHGDAAFSQSLQSLITNSLKYGGDQPWVAVRAFLAENGGKREVCVSVEDRGIVIRERRAYPHFRTLLPQPCSG
jgi:hypothetical protein